MSLPKRKERRKDIKASSLIYLFSLIIMLFILAVLNYIALITNNFIALITINGIAIFVFIIVFLYGLKEQYKYWQIIVTIIFTFFIFSGAITILTKITLANFNQ